MKNVDVFEHFVERHPWFLAAIATGSMVELPERNYPPQKLHDAVKRYFRRNVGTLVSHPWDKFDMEASLGCHQDVRRLRAMAGRQLKVTLLEVHYVVGQCGDGSVITQSVYQEYRQALRILESRGAKLLAVIKVTYVAVDRVCDGEAFDVYLPSAA